MLVLVDVHVPRTSVSRSQFVLSYKYEQAACT